MRNLSCKDKDRAKIFSCFYSYSCFKQFTSFLRFDKRWAIGQHSGQISATSSGQNLLWIFWSMRRAQPSSLLKRWLNDHLDCSNSYYSYNGWEKLWISYLYSYVTIKNNSILTRIFRLIEFPAIKTGKNSPWKQLYQHESICHDTGGEESDAYAARVV